MPTLRVLSKRDVQQAIDMPTAIEVMKDAFAKLSSGAAHMPVRTPIRIEEAHHTCLFMPAYIQGAGLGAKIVSVAADNPSRGLPTILAIVALVDPETGEPRAVLEGSYLTALRTGAGSGAATDLLARKDSRSVAIFGAGVQAGTQLQAMCAVRDIQRVWVFSRTRASAERFVDDWRGRDRVPSDVRIAGSPEEALAQADIVCTATSAHEPIFSGSALRPGTHINGVGSHAPAMRELDEEVIKRSKIVVDARSACMAEAGDILIPLKAGVVDEGCIHAELGEVVLGRRPGRESDEEITLFKSVGVAIQDVSSASRVLAEAAAKNLGTLVEL